VAAFPTQQIDGLAIGEEEEPGPQLRAAWVESLQGAMGRRIEGGIDMRPIEYATVAATQNRAYPATMKCQQRADPIVTVAPEPAQQVGIAGAVIVAAACEVMLPTCDKRFAVSASQTSSEALSMTGTCFRWCIQL